MLYWQTIPSWDEYEFRDVTFFKFGNQRFGEFLCDFKLGDYMGKGGMV